MDSHETVVNIDSFGVWTMFPDDEVPVLRYVPKDTRPNWNKSIHDRYLEALDERDRLQERIDELEDIAYER